MAAEAKDSVRFPWRTAMVISLLALLSVLGFLAVRMVLRAPVDAAGRLAGVVEQVATNLPAVAARFRTGTITHTFVSNLPEVVGTDGDVLEVAVAETDEVFRREDARTALWDSVYLGTTVAEIRVPVTWRYHLRLSEPWQLAAKGNVCLVLAPPIRPSLPPAIHTDRMRKSTERGWARFNEQENLEALERSITPALEARATGRKQVASVRETCRQSVAAFVRRWLMKEDQWRTDRFSAIVVVFPDEVPYRTPLELERHPYRPTIELGAPEGVR